MAGGTSVAARLARFAGLAGDRFFPDRLFLLLYRRPPGRFCPPPADPSPPAPLTEGAAPGADLRPPERPPVLRAAPLAPSPPGNSSPSRTRRKSILRPSRSTRLTCTRTRAPIA